MTAIGSNQLQQRGVSYPSLLINSRVFNMGGKTSIKAKEKGNRMEEIPDYMKDMLTIDREDCLKCGYLVAKASEKFDDCYYMNGNLNCPARGYTIRVGVPRRKLVIGLIKALMNNDVSAISSYASKMQDTHPDTKDHVMDQAKNIAFHAGKDIEKAKKLLQGIFGKESDGIDTKIVE